MLKLFQVTKIAQSVANILIFIELNKLPQEKFSGFTMINLLVYSFIYITLYYELMAIPVRYLSSGQCRPLFFTSREIPALGVTNF